MKVGRDFRGSLNLVDELSRGISFFRGGCDLHLHKIASRMVLVWLTRRGIQAHVDSAECATCILNVGCKFVSGNDAILLLLDHRTNSFSVGWTASVSRRRRYDAEEGSGDLLKQ